MQEALNSTDLDGDSKVADETGILWTFMTELRITETAIWYWHRPYSRFQSIAYFRDAIDSSPTGGLDISELNTK